MVLMFLSVISCNPKKFNEKPNIIIIYVDDLGYADIEPFGAVDISTPNLDDMASEGLVLTDFIVASSVCSPSRAALLLGTYPNRVGLPKVLAPYGADWAKDVWRYGINPQEETLAELLKIEGYKTAIIGKWHLGHLKEHLPLNHGFDYFFGIPYSNDMLPDRNEYYPELPLIENDQIIKIDPDQSNFTKNFTEKSLEFIKENMNSNFFLYLAHPMPHVPLAVSSNFLGKSKAGIYGDVVEELDWSVGEIVDFLKKEKIYDNTILIFTSDNGPWLAYQTHAGSAGNLRGGKNTAFDGGHKVPFIISWPDQLPKGKQLDGLVTNMDLLPTLISWVGGPMPNLEIDGLSVGDFLMGITDHSPREEFLYYHNEDLLGIRDQMFKLLLPHRYQKPAGDSINPGQQDRFVIDSIPLSLFDLWKDPEERNNIAADIPEKVKELQLKMEKEHQKIMAGRRPSGIYEGPEPPVGKLWIEKQID